MSLPLLNSLHQKSYTYFCENFFTLSIKIEHEHTDITMIIHHQYINTQELPHTKTFLKKELPTVLYSECFNDENLPFAKEVTKTEIGHLFEHILLEYLCSEKLTAGYQEATFTGRTHWNWKKEARGVFHITIDTGKENEQFFQLAVEKSIKLLQNVMNNKYQPLTFKKRLPFLPPFQPKTLATPLNECFPKRKLTHIPIMGTRLN